MAAVAMGGEIGLSAMMSGYERERERERREMVLGYIILLCKYIILICCIGK